MKNGRPTLAIIGHGRAGKDTAAEWLRDNTILAYEGGSSWVGRVYMAERLSQDLGRLVTPDEAYARRHEDRMKWFQYLNEYRATDPTRLVRACLEQSDIVCGVRNGCELRQARDEGLIDLIVWIDNPRVAIDPTVEFTIEDADIIIRNATTLEDFYARLCRLATSLWLLSARKIE